MDISFCVGKNAKDNWNLLDNSEPDDIWVHINNYPSCYVIIKNFNNIQKEHIEHACKLCYLKSKNKLPSFLKKIQFCYLECKYVKKGKSTGEAICMKKPNLNSFKRTILYTNSN